MQKGNEFHSPIEAHDLYKKGVIILKKTLVKDYQGRTYKVIRFDYHLKTFCMFVEFPNGDHEPLNQHDIKMMKLEIVTDPGIQRADWEDPP